MKSWLSWPRSEGNRQAEESVFSARSVTFPFSERDPSYSQSRYRHIGEETSSGTSSALCSICTSIDFQGLTSNRRPKERYEVRYGGHQSFSPKCPLCVLLCERVLGKTPSDTSSQSVTFDFVSIYSSSPQGIKSHILDGLWYRSGSKFGHLVFSASSENPAAREVKRRPPVTSYNCREAYDLVRRWLGACSDHHAHCPRDVDVPLPTRVIDVGDATCGPTLYIPPPGARGRYLALSYCWGQSQPVTLTEARLQRPPVGLPLRTLPQTLRDAIIIVSHLGFQYIWIDALCIIQDSFEGRDWIQESANMDKIYGNATLTIVAAAAESAHEGILGFGTEQDESVCTLPYQLPDGQLGSVNVSGFETEDLAKESLDTRAWTLQESLISPRLLRYGTSQMSWKCKLLEENANGPLINRSSQSTNESWTSIVTNFTARTLTYNSDRVTALAGYAKLLGTKRPYDEYFSGLWKSEMLEQLLWYRIAKSDASPRPLSHPTPTWSWVSVDSAVRFTYWPLDYQSHSEILSVSSGPPTRSPSTLGDEPQRNILSIHGYVKHLVNTVSFKASIGVPGFKYTYKIQSQGKRGPEHPAGEVILDISDPFDLYEDAGSLPLVCVHITPTCGLLLIAKKKRDENDAKLYERVGLATGSVFEEWFTDTSSGSYVDELVRIS